MKRPGAGRPGGNPIFSEGNLQSPSAQKMLNHPIWPGENSKEKVMTNIPSIIYQGISYQNGNRRKIPDWIKKASQAFFWGMFLEIQNLPPKKIFEKGKGFIVDKSLITNPTDETVENISINREGKKITITMDLK
ncbi:MAG: hypothetical protein AB4372_10765 [Xenococcus sp. (in: cyanobacteria)]